MPGKSDAWEAGVLNLLLNNTTFANVGDATGLRGSTTAGSLYVSLHTADPTDAGTQTNNEIAYTSYARVAVSRSGSAWTVSGANPTQAVPAANITFPTGTGGSGTATYFGIGTASSGAGVLLYAGQITTPSGGIVCGNTITPVLTTSTAITED